MLRHSALWGIGFFIIVTLLGLLTAPSGEFWAQLTALPDFPTSTPDITPTIPPFPSSTPTPIRYAAGTRLALLTCHAEPKWNKSVNIRRVPGQEQEVLYILDREKLPFEMRVLGRDPAYLWYQVVLLQPEENIVGWIPLERINLFGVCDAIPITSDRPELTAAEVPAPPSPVVIPEFAEHIQLTDHDRVYLVKPGILYIRREIVDFAEKGLQAHILVMNLNNPRLGVEVTVGAVADVTLKAVSIMAWEANALLAINGDYFDNNYMPQNLTIMDGQLISAPKHRATFALSYDREPFIGYFTDGWTWDASVTAANGQSIPLQLMNLSCDPLWLCIYSHHLNGYLTDWYGDVRVLIDDKFHVLNIVEFDGIEIPENHFVLSASGETGQWLLDNIEIGDRLQIDMKTDPDWQDYRIAIGGGPRFILDGEIWHECDPEEDQPDCEEFSDSFRSSHYYGSSIPRTAIGYSQDGGLLVAVMVEGYEVEDSRGMTQHELADLMLDMGVYQAMEFDGGGSSSMFMRPGGLINDVGEKGERHVSNALLFFWDDR